MNRIILVVLAGNEQAIITRCLGAALPHVDAFVVAWNGDDGTLDEAIRVGNILQKPGIVDRQPWQDFGANRTRSFELAKEYATEQGFDLEHTWALVLDADMVLRGSIDRDALAADGYELEQRKGEFAYANLRLLKLAAGWRCDYPTHELWRNPREPGVSAWANAGDAWIDDRDDGRCKADKLERDERLLRGYLAEHPGDARCVFYLAETLRFAKRLREATELYAARAVLGGFAEERWYARMMHGRCLLEAGDERGISVLLRAFDERPGRAEPLYEVGRYLREHDMPRAAFGVLTQARSVPPSKDRLFVDRAIERKVLEELARCAHYVGELDLGRELCETLATRPGVDDTKNHVVQSWYLRPVVRCESGELLDKPLGGDFAGYAPCNPSITTLSDGTELVNVRLVNYEQERGRNYVSRDGDGVFRTRNLLGSRRPGEEIVWRELEQGLADWPINTNIVGLEDIRLCRHSGATWFTATCNQVPGKGPKSQVVIGRIDERSARVEMLAPIPYKRAREVEKNWVPWSVDGELRLIYSWAPFTLLTRDGELVAELESPNIAKRWRGSSSPVVIGGRIVAVVHEVALRGDWERIYAHRLVELDPERGVVSYSEPFCFEDQGVEYVCGAAAVLGDLVITYGVGDREARWLKIPGAAVERLLPRRGASLRAA